MRKILFFALCLGFIFAMPDFLPAADMQMGTENASENRVATDQGGFIIKGGQDGSSYMTGGIGVDERKIMEETAAGYNLKMVFADKAGHYVGQVKVTITDRDGDSFIDAVRSGPWFFADLNSGTFRVDAVFRDETVSKTITLNARNRKTLYVHFK